MKSRAAVLGLLLALGPQAVVAQADRTPPPGEGVLCLGGFIYMADLLARECFAGDDPEFAARLAGYAARYDDYIVRNNPDGEAGLAYFKEDEGLTSATRPEVCTSEYTYFYSNFRDTDRAQMEQAIEEQLSRDGPPSYGDCV